MSKTPARSRGSSPSRERYSIGAQLSRAEHERIELERLIAGCTATELVRSALKLDAPVHPRPLLVAAGQLIRAGNAHAAAASRGEWAAAAAGVDEMNRHARELIRLAIKVRQLT